MSRRLILLPPTLLFIGIGGLLAQRLGARPAESPAPRERLFYVVKHGTAQALAEVLSKHFGGDATIQPLPEASGNGLLISAPPKVIKEITKILEQSDRPLHLVTIQLWIADLGSAKGNSARPAEQGTGPGDGQRRQRLRGRGQARPTAESSPSATALPAPLQTLERKGQLRGYKQVSLTTVEYRQASLLSDDSKPYTTGLIRNALTGAVRPIISYRSVGTMVRATTHWTPEHQFAVDLWLDDSRQFTAADSPVFGKDENGETIHSTDFASVHIDTHLLLTPGQPLIVGVRTKSKSGKPQTMVVALAKFADAEGASVRDKQGAAVPGTFTLKVPEMLVLKPGGSQTLAIELRRFQFRGGVRVRLADLPRGVTAEPKTCNVARGATACQFKLMAAKDAAPGEYDIGVFGQASEGPPAYTRCRLTVSRSANPRPTRSF